MIRWSYLLPRLVLLVLLLLVLGYGVPSLVRWSVICGAHRITGAAVQIDKVWVSPARAKIRADGVQIAQSHESGQNLLQFQSATLQLDRAALAHRQFVVDNADVRGLRFDGVREVTDPPPALSGLQFGDKEQLKQTASRVGHNLFSSLWGGLSRQYEEEFQSVRLTRELCHRWPAEYDKFAEQVRACRLSGERLHGQLRTRSWTSIDRKQLESLQTAWTEARELQSRFEQLQADLGRLAGQVERDREEISEAFTHDRELLRSKVANVKFDASLWDRFLLEGEVREWQRRVTPWIRLVRRSTGKPVLNEVAGRGLDIALDSATFPPGLFIRAARVNGTIPLGEDDLPFSGHVENLSRWPAYRAEPCTMHLALGDGGHMVLDAEFGHSAGVVRRWARFRCNGIVLEQREWGDSDSLAVRLSPGTADLEVEFEMRGEQVNGRILLVQRGFGCSLHVGPEFKDSTPAGAEFVRAVTAAVQHVKTMQVVISITGTVDDPTWKIDSDLPRRMLPDVRQAVHSAVVCHAELMDKEARAAIVAQLADLENLLSFRQTEMTDQLGESAHVLSSLTEPVTAQLKPARRLLRW